MIHGDAPAEVSTSALREIAEVAERYSANAVAEFARAAAERVGEGRFFLACVGQFKRGKSTLINALVGGTGGHAVLPAGVSPVTSVPTVLRYGDRYSARVRFANGEWVAIDPASLTAYVSEAENPGNTKNVGSVEVFAPSPLLASGLNLVDTPGIGSVFGANTAATLDFLPHMDAALVVLGADPPISGEERSLVAELAPRVSRLVFVLNKSDRVSTADSAAAAEFTRSVLNETLGHSRFDIFCVSALEQLNHVPEGPTRDWPALQSALREIFTSSGREIVQDAGRRATTTAASRLLGILDAERRTLTEPFAASEARIAHLDSALRGAETHLADLGALLAVQERRISADFSRRRNEFLPVARRACRNGLRERATALGDTRNGPALRRTLNRIAQDVVRAELAPFLAAEAKHGECAFAAANARFAELGNECLRRITSVDTACIDALSTYELTPPSLSARSEYRFNFIERVAAPASPFRFIADVVLGACGSHAAIARSSDEFLDQLIETNSSRIQNDLARRVSESRRTLETVIRARLNEAVLLATRSLARARTVQAEGSGAVLTAVSKIDLTARRIRALQAGLSARDCDT